MARPSDPINGASAALRIVSLIARREFMTRARSRFYQVGTVLLMAMLGGFILLQALVLGHVTTTVKAGFVGDAHQLAAPLATLAGSKSMKIENHVLSDVASGENQVRSGTLDLLVSGDPAAPQVAVKDQLDPTVAAALEALVRQAALNRALTASGIDPSAVQAQVASANFNLVLLDSNAAQRTQRQVVGVFVAALLYVALVLYGQFVATSVVEEKASRIIEILLSTVRARQLLFGKVIGVGLLGLLQLILLGLVALIAISRTQVISVPSVGVVAVASGLLWFVLGFVFYAFIFAAAGAMVSRQEDLPSVMSPVVMLILGSYLAFFWVLANPDSPIATLLSVLPPLAPVLMPARIATGDAQAWQVAVAVALTIAGIAAMNRLAARIYTNSVLRIGGKVGFREAWKGPA